MEKLEGKVAAITGGASGIGLSMARRFAKAGMKLSLADIEGGPLEEAAASLEADGTEVLTRVVDVSDGDQMDGWAEATLAHFGTVHVVCNNAGVGSGGRAWEMTTEDWQFVLGPNLWGVIHGVRVFGKHLVDQNEGHVVNTASMAGLISAPGMSPYNVSKHAVVTLSETLYRDLRAAGANVGVSVLCPGFVNTKIADPGRFRDDDPDSEASRQRRAAVAQFMASAMSPDRVAEMVHDAVVNDTFYILTHEGTKEAVLARVKRMVDGKSPAPIDASSFIGRRGG